MRPRHPPNSLASNSIADVKDQKKTIAKEEGTKSYSMQREGESTALREEGRAGGKGLLRYHYMLSREIGPLHIDYHCYYYLVLLLPSLPIKEVQIEPFLAS